MNLTPLDVTPKQRENLTRLADYLAGPRPPDLTGFDMQVFFSTGAAVADVWPHEAEPRCGTVACAVGHGPLAGIAPNPGEHWLGYANRAFGVTFGSSRNPDGWEWLFSSKWRHVDNTPEGAAARIRFALERGVPDYYTSALMQEGGVPLCYT